MRGAPVGILRAADDQPLENQLVRAARAFRQGEVLPLGGRLRLRLDDVNRRHRADFDTRLVVAHELIGELDRPARRLRPTAPRRRSPSRRS